MDTYNLQINKGETFTLSITVSNDDGSPMNLSSSVVSGYLKFKYSDSNKLTDLNPVVVTPASGIVSLSISATGTAALPVMIGVYDLEATNTGNGVVTKLLAGKAYVYPEVTY
jgi:hypothetical protein